MWALPNYQPMEHTHYCWRYTPIKLMMLPLLCPLLDYEGVSEVWQLVPPDMFSLISIPFQGRSVKVGVSSDHVM